MFAWIRAACVAVALISLTGLAWGADEKPAKPKKDDAAQAKSEQKPAADKKEAKKKPVKKAEEKPDADEAKPEGKEEAKAEKPAEKTEEKPAKPTTHTVARETFEIEVKVDGVFESQKMSEIVLRPQEWQGLTLVSAVEHGASVKRGDVLASLELEKIDRALADLRTELKTSQLAIKQAEQELRTLETLAPMDLAAAERSQKQAKEDFDFYKKVFRPLNVRMADFSLKVSGLRLENAKEELAQLEKMYNADDLTEETEQIVLKRARTQVEMAQFSYEAAKIQHEDAMKRELPRTDVTAEESTKRADIAWQRTRTVLPATLERQRLELEKLRVQRARSEERLEKLTADRESMIVKAPADGVVYYGSCDRGRWSSAGSDELRRGTTLQANKVFMTVVAPRPMFVRVNIPEKQLHNVRVGMPATIQPASDPQVKLRGILERVGSVPISAGQFDGRITVTLDDKAEGLMPGMTGEVKLLAYEKKDAVVVPLAAVEDDKTDDQKHYVYTVGDDGEPKKKAVKVGKRTDKQVEILTGLKPGDEILPDASKAKDKK